jgi:hypothetical protein
MSRLATRRTKKLAGGRRFASFKKTRNAAKRNNTGIGTPNKMYMNTIDNFLNNIQTVAKQRRARNGAADAIAKKLHLGTVNARGQFRKANYINPNMTKYLHNIGYSLRGVKTAAKAQLPRIFKNLKEGVRRDVVLFVGTLNRTIRSMTYEFTKWETVLRRNYASAKAGTKKYTIDPAIKRQLKSFENNVSAFKTKWNKLLSSLSTHGNVQVQAAVRMIKKELETLQKSIRTNRVLVNSIVKTSAAKKKSKVRAQALITKNELKTHYNKWMKKQQMFQNFRNGIFSYVDQLKAIKTC